MSRGRSMSIDGRSRSRGRSRSFGPRRRAKKMLNTEGKYTGPFAFPSKKSKIMKNPVAVRGSSGQIEGNIEDCKSAHVTYIGFTSFIRALDGGSTENPIVYIGSPVYHVAAAMVRKMFKKYYQVDFDRHDQTLAEQMLGTNVNGLVKIWYKREVNPAGTGSTTAPPTTNYESVSFTNATTFGSLALEVARKLSGLYYGARGYVVQSVTIGGAANQISIKYTLFGMSLSKNEGGGGQFDMGIERFDSQYVKINVKNVIYIQNQTKSDSDGTAFDVIDANPIHGKIFYFKDPYPDVRYELTGSSYTGNEYKLMHDANGDGVIYPDADVAGSHGTTPGPWAQMPRADMFKNLSRYSNVALAPGEMKKLVFRFKFDGHIQKFIEGLCLGSVTSYVGGVGDNPSVYQNMRMTDALGTSVLFAFEKRLSTGTGQVEIAVQRNVYASAVLGGKKKRTLMPATYVEQAIPKDDTTGPAVVVP